MRLPDSTYHRNVAHHLFIPAEFLPDLMREALSPNPWSETAKLTWCSGRQSKDDPLGSAPGLKIEFTTNSVSQYGSMGRDEMRRRGEAYIEHSNDEDNWY